MFGAGPAPKNEQQPNSILKRIFSSGLQQRAYTERLRNRDALRYTHDRREALTRRR
tara:strand:- start:354 stop:521 length:168 start_codon:yes stop_codon:yes gene_type:complete